MKKARKNQPLCSDYDSEIQSLCPGSIIPLERRMKVFKALHESGKSHKTTIVIDSEVNNPLVLVGIMATDWPGLANICLSELHHRGWNLDAVEGFNIDEKGHKLGFVIAGIRDDDPERRSRFENDARNMENLMIRLAGGSSGTISLLSRAAERLEKYDEVRRALEHYYRKTSLPDAYLGETGELVQFLSSRSDEYLRERKAEDLAWIVRKNYELVEGVRKRRGRPMFSLKNLKTTKEHLTGISLAGYERSVSFQDSLTALSFAWPGSTVRHQRRYTTLDGIIAMRIEMAGPTGLAATRAEQIHIIQTLKRLLVRNDLERLKKIHRYGGRENYARALIPLLLRECDNTGINQGYISIISTSTFHTELKLLLVTKNDNSDEHDGKIIELVGLIEEFEGLGVVSFKSPSNYGSRWLDIIDITVQRDFFPEIESAYEAVKTSIENSFGKFRDFDMGMRLNDVRQLTEIKKVLKHIPENAVTDFYYHLEDFLRGSAPISEIAMHINLAFNAMEKIRNNEDIVKPISVDIFSEENPDIGIATLICCAGKGDHGTMFHDLLEVLKEFTVTASVMDWSDGTALLLKVQHQGGVLPHELLKKVLEDIEKVCQKVSGS